jgi:hypothetical protein
VKANDICPNSSIINYLVINAERAAMRAPEFQRRNERTRNLLLQGIVDTLKSKKAK